MCFSGGWFRLTARMPDWVNILIDWFALPSLAVLAVVLLYRRWHKEFPLFFSYVVATPCGGSSGSPLPGLPWTSIVVCLLDFRHCVGGFAFLATYELFIKRLFPGFYKIRFFRYLFPSAAVAIGDCSLCRGFTAINRSCSLPPGFTSSSCGNPLVLCGVDDCLGRRWEKQEFGIAFGFALGCLFIAGFNRHRGHNQSQTGYTLHHMGDASAESTPVVAHDIA